MSWNVKIPKGTPRSVIEKLDNVLDTIESGNHPHAVQRMKWDRNVISVAIGHRYRLLVDASSDRWEPKQLLSHQDYNNIVRNNCGRNR